MKIRWLIALAALLGASCKTNRNSALVVTKMVLGQVSGTTCAYDPGSDEFDFANIDPAANSGGTMGVVLQNNLSDPSTLNQLLRTNSATFHPHQVVADYEVIGGTTLANQIIPVSGVQITAGGGTGPVLVPFFSPAGTATLTGMIRVTFHVEGKLDDGSVLKSSEHEYIFVTCSTAGCNSACL
jgi:hypothetical protein